MLQKTLITKTLKILTMMTTVMVMTVCRFKLWVRESCRQSSDSSILPCPGGQLKPVVNSLVYSAYVDDLTPYTNYEFQLSVDNEAGSLQEPVSTFATTLPAGIDFRLLIIDCCYNFCTRKGFPNAITLLFFRLLLLLSDFQFPKAWSTRNPS